MMRPAQAHHDTTSILEETGALSVLPELEHHEEGATRPPFVMLTVTDDSADDLPVWRGDAGDWQRCHLALRRLGRDGRKLELWARWLGVPAGSTPASRTSSLNLIISPFVVSSPQATESGNHVTSGALPAKDIQSTDSGQTKAIKVSSDSRAGLAPAAREHVAAVIRGHVSSYAELHAPLSTF